jgi:thioredoxin reductase
MNEKYDVIIVGGGPAGLNAALVLGRCLRKVLVLDEGQPRNRFTDALHGFLTRDGIEPSKLLRKAQKECLRYGVKLMNEKVVSLNCKKASFTATTDSGKKYEAKKVLLATGLSDELPPFEGINDYYGHTAFHCPFCDAYEFKGKPWVVYANTVSVAVENCLRYKSWTGDVTLLAQDLKITKALAERLRRNGVKIVSDKVVKLIGRKPLLKGVQLEDGRVIATGVLFFSVRSHQNSDLSRQAGCRRTPKGILKLNKMQQTSVSGLYVAGDMAREMQLAVIAAAEGAKAAVAIHLALNKEERA